MNDSSAVRALLAASEPDGPQEHELCSVAFLAAVVQSFHTKLTDREALHLVFRALCGFDAWDGLAPSQLTVYRRGYLDRITPLCRVPVDCHDGDPPLPSEFDCKFKRADDMSEFFVVWADARKAFDLLAPPPAPAPAAVKSEPAPAPEQRAEPVWKDGDEWTPAAVAEMERLYVQEGLSLSAIGRIMGGRVGGPAISRQRVRQKIPGAVRSGKGKCNGARG